MILAMNLTRYMGPIAAWPKIEDYATKADEAIQAGRYTGPLTARCPECDAYFGDVDEAHEDTEHILAATTSDTFAVIVACEGYFVVDPNSVGFDSPNWSAAGGDLGNEVTGVLHDIDCHGNHPDMGKGCPTGPAAGDRDQLLMSAILARSNGDILNIVQAAGELPGSVYDRLSKAYNEITGAS